MSCRHSNSCKVCGESFGVEEIQMLIPGSAARLADYMLARRLVNHVKKCHSELYDEIAKKAFKRKKRRTFYFIILEIIVRLPIFVICLPLYLVKIGLDNFFEFMGEVWHL